MTQGKNYRPTFYLTINALFIAVIIFIGGILAWHNYSDTKKIILSEVEQEYDHTLVSLAKDFQHTYKPVFDTVSLLSMTPIMDAPNLDERLQQLHLMTAAMGNRAEVAGLQIGYENGDYFIVRPTSSRRLRSLFDAPDNTAFTVDSITTDSATGQRFLERLFFDESMAQIWRKAPEVTEYDPRVRPWYLQAVKTDRVAAVAPLSLIHISEPTRRRDSSRMPSTA